MNKQGGQILISAIVVMGFVASLFMLLAQPVEISQTVREVLLVLVGNLSAMFCVVVQFWVGSSQSSRDKDAMLLNAKPPGGS